MDKEQLYAENLFDYSKTIARSLFESVKFPWEALSKINMDRKERNCFSVGISQRSAHYL